MRAHVIGIPIYSLRYNVMYMYKGIFSLKLERLLIGGTAPLVPVGKGIFMYNCMIQVEPLAVGSNTFLHTKSTSS